MKPSIAKYAAPIGLEDVSKVWKLPQLTTDFWGIGRRTEKRLQKIRDHVN